MAYFDSQNGWLQLVFANQEDYYYLPSLIRVKFEKYVYFCLRQNKYEKIYFAEKYGDNFEVHCLDEASAEYYSKIYPKGFIFKNSEKMTVGSALSVTRDKMERIYYNIMNGRVKSAIVFSMPDFYDLFNDPAKKKKITSWSKEKTNLRNLTVITTTTIAEDSKKYLLNENGVYRNLLSYEIREAEKPGSEHFYKKLKKNLGERCVYLNAFNYHTMKNIVWNSAVLFNSLPMNVSILEKMTVTLDWYYNSDDFRQFCSFSLPENRRNEYKILNDILKNQRKMDEIIEWLTKYSTNKSAHEFDRYLENTFKKNTNDCCIYSNNILLQNWNRLLSKNNEKTLEPYRILILKIFDRLKGIMYRSVEEINDSTLDASVQIVQESLNRSDIKSFEYALKEMEYLTEHYYEDAKVKDKVIEIYKNILELSKQLQTLIIQNQSARVDIENWENEIIEYYTKYKKIIDVEGKSSQNLNLQPLMLRIKECRRNAEIQRTALKTTTEEETSVRQMITRLESAISSQIKGDLEDAEIIMKRVTDMEIEATKNKIARLGRIESIDKERNLNINLEEEMNYDDLEKEFEKTRKEIEEIYMKRGY